MITLAILAVVHRKLGRRFKPMQGMKEVEEQSSQTWDFSKGKETLSMSYALYNSNYRDRPPWDKEDTSSDSRPDTMGNHFICRNCSLSSRRKTFHHRTNCRGVQPSIEEEEEWSTYLGNDQWKDTDVCPSRINNGGMKRWILGGKYCICSGLFLYILTFLFKLQMVELKDIIAEEFQDKTHRP